MVASVTIVIMSAAMLLAWGRYTLLLLRNGQRDFALKVIREHDLKFRELHIGQPASAIDETLRRDGAVLDSLLRHVLPAYGFEMVLLRVDFAIMRLWWRFTQSRWENCAACALKEMMRVLDTRAGLIGLVEANQ